jgi:hypothetical protein
MQRIPNLRLQARGGGGGLYVVLKAVTYRLIVNNHLVKQEILGKKKKEKLGARDADASRTAVRLRHP